MLFGCAWYPEQWEESRWPEDLRLMREAGMNVVRIGEFAWSRLEPADGEFHLDWLARAVTLAASFGIQAIIGTPTAAPPAWLTQAHPETLVIRADGKRATHGARCHGSPTSPVYRGFCGRIAEELARRFGRNPHVIGWQIDNEFNAVSHGDEALDQFRQWLRARHGTLANLNRRWTTAYWSEEYFDWSQIQLPQSGHNPGLLLDWRRFITETFCSFQRVQVEAIRRHAAPRQLITHNCMGWYDAFDHYRLNEQLDIACWDSYVGTGHLDYLSSGAPHDLTRGFKRRNFWLLEMQPGSVNWSPLNNALDRGETRCLAWHAVGHGANAVCFWQWRSALNGQEQYHGTLVAPDGAPRPLYAEAAELGRELAAARAALRDTSPVAEIAILHSYEDRWAINGQRHHQDFDPVKHLLSFYRPLRAMGHGIDIIHPLAPLAGYRLVIAPHLHVLTPELANHLRQYVEAGGHLVLGPRSGMKDSFNALLPARQPGPLAVLAGAHVEEYYALETPIPVSGAAGAGTARIWAEWLHADAADAEVLLRYSPANGWLDGQAAAVTRPCGKGRVTLIGAWLDEELMTTLSGTFVAQSTIEPPRLRLPPGVELCRRAGPGGRVVCILINHTAAPQTVTFPQNPLDLLTGSKCSGSVVLAPRQVAVLTASE